jgi:signal transduction histidine kinase
MREGFGWKIFTYHASQSRDIYMTDTPKIRQLERQLAEVGNVSNPDIPKKVDILNDLAWALCDTDLKRSQTLSEAAYTLANSPSEGQPPDLIGMAYSLRTQGYLNQRMGDYPLGLSQLLKAQELFESLQLDEGLPDVFDGLAGIYFQIGNFPEALAYMYQQLEAAQRLGNKRLIANAYNNLANIYFETGDHNRAIETLHHNLQIATETGYKRIESLSYLNLAETYLLAGDDEKALKNAQRGLQVSQEAKFELFEVYAFDLIGKVYLKLDDAPQAIPHLEQALALSREIESKVTESLILLNLGQAYRQMPQLDLALDYLQQSITTAQSINANSELFKGHLLLSEIFEQQGNFAQALYHFKQHQTFKELVLGEKADQRLKVLQVAHDTETARAEAELLQLKTEELRKINDRLEQQVAIRTGELNDTIALLKQEISEREQAQAETQRLLATLEQRVAARTEELATFFDLTVLAGHAANLSDVFQQAIPRILEVTRSRVICLHLFEADRPGLRLAAQQNLPAEAHLPLQIVEPPPDFWRWLQQPHDPLMTTHLSTLAMLPPAFRLPEFQSYLGAQIRVGDAVKGLLSCYRFTERGFSLNEISLGVALAEQMGMVLETHRLRQVAEEVAVLEERQRLARELHDSVTQAIYSLTLFARSSREAAEDGDLARLTGNLREIETSALQTLQEMRLLLYELRAPLPGQEGLAQALEMRLNLVERRAGLRVTYQVDLGGSTLPHTLELELYRLAIEALNNIIKHANAREITLDLQAANGQVYLKISDDGCGFEPKRLSGGFGLPGMQERVARLGGALDITSAPGQGTKISIEVELADERLT